MLDPVLACAAHHAAMPFGPPLVLLADDVLDEVLDVLDEVLVEPLDDDPPVDDPPPTEPLDEVPAAPEPVEPFAG